MMFAVAIVLYVGQFLLLAYVIYRALQPDRHEAEEE